MKLIELKWKNFGSYGNNEQILKFDEISSFNLLFGANGAGKSTIRNIIEFVIYGRVSDKKNKDLINRINQKQLETYIKISVENNIIEIYRGLQPNIFKVIINGKDDINNLAGKTNIQDYIENELLKIPFYVFNNIISLSINDFKSFIKMTPKDKRTIIDQIFGISIINEMNELLKKDIKDSKEKLNKSNIQINVIKNQIEKSLSEMEILKETIKNADEEKKKDLNIKLKKLAKLKNVVDEELNEINSSNKEQYQEYQEYQKKIKNIEKQIYSINDKLSLYDEKQCPVCGSDLDSDIHKLKMEELKNTELKLNKVLIKLNKLAETIKISIEENNESIETLKEKLNKIYTNNKLISNEINELNKSSSNNELNTIKKIIKENKDEVENIENDKKIIQNELLFYDIVSNILGEDGIKKTAIKTILPMINKTIDEISTELYLDFKLFFDEKFESVITHIGKEILSNSLSTGEMKKLDFAVIVAIIRLMKYKFPGLNILFLDEIFASLDTSTSYSILKILKDLSTYLNMHIFVVNHSIFDTSAFDKVYSLNKNNSFTQLEILTNN